MNLMCAFSRSGVVTWYEVVSTLHRLLEHTHTGSFFHKVYTHTHTNFFFTQYNFKRLHVAFSEAGFVRLGYDIVIRYIIRRERKSSF